MLARLHREMAVGQVLRLTVTDSPLPAARLGELLTGGGFEVEEAADRRGRVRLAARRARTLPDTVGPAMRVLVCGLNPSLVAADAGYGYAGRSNRFWPAAVASELVTVARDPDAALEVDGVGMTDLVKRATAGASELHGEEYRAGLARLHRLVEWLAPERVLFVGLAGWRAGVARGAAPGWQPGGVAGVPAYVMPSTSGLNARTRVDELVDHMRAAIRGPRAVA